MAKTRTGLGFAAALVAGAVFAQPSETPLARLESAGAKIGWDGITLGMSSVQVERRSGVTLAVQQNSGSTAGGSCRAYVVTIERDTLGLTLGFPSSKPGAKLQSIYVHFEGYQVLAKQAALVQELRERVPQASYLPPTGASPPPEASDPVPTYLVPRTEYALRLVPGDGLQITLRNCLD